MMPASERVEANGLQPQVGNNCAVTQVCDECESALLKSIDQSLNLLSHDSIACFVTGPYQVDMAIPVIGSRFRPVIKGEIESRIFEAIREIVGCPIQLDARSAAGEAKQGK